MQIELMPGTEKLEQAAVRPYRPHDREAVLQIGADTAFFGAPIETYLDDRRIFMDGFYAYYTDYEPQHAWTAVCGGRVVGFLTGCTDTRAYQRVLLNIMVPRMLARLVRRRYRVGRKTLVYFMRLAQSRLQPGSPTADLERYPAHLHINLLPEARGRGLGERLMQSYLQQLAGLGVGGAHLHTTSYNRAACHLYERLGFELAAARRTRMWHDRVAEAVDERVYTRRVPL